MGSFKFNQSQAEAVSATSLSWKENSSSDVTFAQETDCYQTESDLANVGKALKTLHEVGVSAHMWDGSLKRLLSLSSYRKRYVNSIDGGYRKISQGPFTHAIFDAILCTKLA